MFQSVADTSIALSLRLAFPLIAVCNSPVISDNCKIFLFPAWYFLSWCIYIDKEKKTSLNPPKYKKKRKWTCGIACPLSFYVSTSFLPECLAFLFPKSLLFLLPVWAGWLFFFLGIQQCSCYICSPAHLRILANKPFLVFLHESLPPHLSRYQTDAFLLISYYLHNPFFPKGHGNSYHTVLWRLPVSPETT